MKLATWNVNSIRARVDLLVDWLQRRGPDVLAIQETKVVDELFPAMTLAEIGYHSEFVGEKSYNGVALVSTKPLQQVHVDYPLAGNAEARLISGVLGGITIYSAYFPNGRDPASPYFPQKIAWIDALAEMLSERQGTAVLLGDFNVAPEARDVYDPVTLDGQLHFHPDERAALHRLMAIGLVDAFRLIRTEDKLYSWWDYRAGMFRRNLGLRIDHAWISAPLADKVTDAFIDKAERAKDHTSDHAPVVVEFAL